MGLGGELGVRADVRETYIEDPICCGCNGVCWSSDIERLRVFRLVAVSSHNLKVQCNITKKRRPYRNFSRIQPSHAQPADRKETVKHKQKDCSCNSCRYMSRIRVGNGSRPGQNCHGACLANCSEEHELSSTNSLDGEDGDQGGEEVLGAVECC